MQKMVELTGAIHVHSRYSDGSDGMEKIIAAAADAKLDFVVVSDHNTLKAKKLGWEGWHDSVLVVVGCEISPPRAGHCVVLNVDEFDRMKKMTPPQYLEKVRQQNGIAFVAHPKGSSNRDFALTLAGWSHWDNDNYAGLEIWSYMHDWIEGCNLRNLRDYLRRPEEHITGPPPQVLEMWDHLAAKRRISGIGALDNHAANVPFRKLPLKLLKIFPHEFCFRTVRTHVIMPQPTHRNGDVQTFIDAIGRGQCFVDYLPLGDGTGFSFTAECGDEVYQMGDEMASGKPAVFKAVSPVPAQLKLLFDGQPVAAAEGKLIEYPSESCPRGVYRVEARVDGRPWLFTNHIYVR